MRRFENKTVPIQGYCTALACLIALGCGGDSGSQTPPATGAGTTGAPTGTSGTAATPTGTAGNTTTGTTAGRGAAGPAAATTAGRGPTATGGTGAAAAGTGMAAAGTGAAGTGAAPTGGTGAMPMPTGDPGAASVLQFHKNATRDGVYVDATLTRAAAAMLKKDASFNAMTNGAMWAQPLYWDAGGKDLIITATQTNEVSALDATTGAMVWRKTLAPAVSSGLPCGNITPLGVTGTPVIDATTKTLYVAAMTQGPKHQIFALSLDDGSVKPGWPADLSNLTSTGGVKFASPAQNQRGALLLLGDMLYVPYGGHFGDCGDYRGWVVGIPVNNPAAPIGFATDAQAGGIWAPGGLASDGTSIFAGTGNTMARANGILSTPGTWGHGNAILRLGKDLKTIAQGSTKDFYAAQNWMQFDQGDLDLGSSGAVLVSVPGATPSDLVVAFGKSGGAFLLDRANLGGMGGHIATKAVSGSGLGGGVIIAPVAYTTPTGTFVVFRGTQTTMGCGMGMGNIGALKIDAASPPTINVAWCASPNSTGSPAVTTTDGKAESIVWYTSSGKLIGLNGETGMQVASIDGAGTTAKWAAPIAAKGRIFVGTNSGVVAFTTK